jgi:uncharacterized protein DUF5675
MKLVLNRDNATPKATMGQLWLDGHLVAYTLELPKKDGLPGSAIPAGTYKIGIYPSPHFGRPMPLLEGIPGRSQIEIHWGNDVVDTRGCILVGEHRDLSTNEIFNTRKKFEELFPAIEQAVGAEGCWIEVNDPLTNAQDVAEIGSGN